MSERKKKLTLTRRRFMAVSSAAVAAPFVMKMTGAVPYAGAAEKAAERPYAGMKSVVIYYSQSGNTKKIGQAIQKGIISQTGQCDLVRVKEIKPAELEKYDLIGIGTPTWGSTPVPLVGYFCKGLPSTLKGKHFFWFTTHGMTPGRTIIRGVQPLLNAGFTVIGWRDWFCGASLPGHAKPWFTDGHPDEIDLVEGESWGKAMVVHSRKISEGLTSIIPKLPSKEGSDLIYGLGMPFAEMDGGGGPPEGNMPEGAGGRGGGMPGQTTGKGLSTPPPIPTSGDYTSELEGLPKSGGMEGGLRARYGDDLKINPAKCIKCKLCVRGCPCNNIDDSTFPFTFISQNCEGCLYCEGICPVGAIEIIDNYQAKQKAKNQSILVEGENNDTKRTPGTFEIQLYLSEARGRFRRLVKEEDVGYNTPWEVATAGKHPRHKELP